jgi:adenine deaminase
MATFNAATYLGLDRKLGGLGPGMRADILLVEDLRRPFPETVVADGKVAVRKGECLIKIPSLPPVAKSIPWLSHRLIPLSVKPGDFIVKASVSNRSMMVPVLSIVNNTITEIENVTLPVKKSQISLPSDQDILKISMLRKDGAGFVTAFLKGFGIKVGGLATSLSHERHMPMVIGCLEDDMAFALHHLRKTGGGLALVHHGRVVKEIPLPIGGVMSDCSLERLEDQTRAFRAVLKEMGCPLEDPLFTLSFLSFSALPWGRMTPSGLLDVKKREIIWSGC